LSKQLIEGNFSFKNRGVNCFSKPTSIEEVIVIESITRVLSGIVFKECVSSGVFGPFSKIDKEKAIYKANAPLDTVMSRYTVGNSLIMTCSVPNLDIMAKLKANNYAVLKNVLGRYIRDIRFLDLIIGAIESKIINFSVMRRHIEMGNIGCYFSFNIILFSIIMLDFDKNLKKSVENASDIMGSRSKYVSYVLDRFSPFHTVKTLKESIVGPYYPDKKDLSTNYFGSLPILRLAALKNRKKLFLELKSFFDRPSFIESFSYNSGKK